MTKYEFMKNWCEVRRLEPELHWPDAQRAWDMELTRLRTENDQLKGQIRLKDMQVAELNKSILPHMPSEKIARALCCACGEDPNAVGDAKGNDYRWQDFLECVLLFREALK